MNSHERELMQEIEDLREAMKSKGERTHLRALMRYIKENTDDVATVKVGRIYETCEKWIAEMADE